MIIGAGPAGVVAAEPLREYDPDGTVTLIGEEPEPPYSPMAIPYLLMDRIDERGTFLRKDPAHFDKLRIEVVRDRVTAVNPAAKTVALAGGGTAAYDKLLIATGASPMVPPIPGVDREGVHACWTLEDARWIAKRARKGVSRQGKRR